MIMLKVALLNVVLVIGLGMRKDGGDDMYVCHRCGTDNEKYFGKDNSFEEDISFKDGGEVKTFSRSTYIGGNGFN